jgi:nucleotide-binding universal stress UspA family protein
MVDVKRILFPCDLTPHASLIFGYALGLARKLGSELSVLHVVQDLREWAGLYVPHKSLGIEQDEVVENARRSLDEFCYTILQGRSQVRQIVVSGDPAAEIIRAAGQEGADLIVMGTHGRKGLELSLFGSVAAKTVRHSTVPVLTVNPEHLK